MTVDHPLPDRAKNVPAIRDTLIGQWRAIDRYPPELVLSTMSTSAKSEIRMLADAQLVWVADSFVPLMRRVALSMPDDIAHGDAGLLWPNGLAVFQRPFEGVDTIGDNPIFVHAVCWGKVTIEGRDGIGISSFSMIDGEWYPMGRSDWMVDERIGEVYDRGRLRVDDRTHASFVEDRKMLVALHRLMAQEKYVERDRWEPRSKSAKRRAARDGGNFKVEVVHLRRERVGERPTSDTDSPAGESRYRHRWWVDPYPRWQPCGPGGRDRKLIIVEGHMRGPDGKPFLDRERVWSLDR